MEEQNEQRTEINEFGEFELIDHLTKDFPVKNISTVKGVGDDAAVLSYDGKKVVVTTDLLIEGIHFDLMYMPLKHLGYKAVSVNVSDICAMNAIAKQITVSFAVSNRFSVEALDELYSGVLYACRQYGLDLIGGDSSTSNKGAFISVTAIGEADENKITYRTGAHANDLLCVTGDLGAAYLGLQILEREKKLYLDDPNIKPDLENQTYLLQRQLRPEARVDVIKLLNELEIVPTSMIDISDGLSSEILHLSKQSNLGCRLDETKIPISDEARAMAFKFNLDPTTCALNGGEDYELLFTLKPADFEKVRNQPDITVIGFMTELEKGIKLISRNNHLYDLVAQGWNAFKESEK
jgi:thiamine-monophosphate kinase